MVDRKTHKSGSLRVALVAEEAAGLRTLLALSRRNEVETCCVLTSAKNRIEAKASALGVPTYPARSAKDPGFAEVLVAARIDLLLNAHSLYLISPAVLDAPRLGCFNLHPSPLPAYGGLNAVSWAIWNQEPEHGVTIHWMVPEVDAGDIAYQSVFPISPAETALTLSAKCVRSGLVLVERLIDDALQGDERVPRIKQPESGRSYYKGASRPEEVRIDWNRRACDIERIVRACSYYPGPSPWGLASCLLNGRTLGLLKARSSEVACEAAPGTVRPLDDMRVSIACSDKWLSVEHVLYDGEARQAPEVLGTDMRLELES